MFFFLCIITITSDCFTVEHKYLVFFITEIVCVYCAVRTNNLSIFQILLSLSKVNMSYETELYINIC
jgi:hypothetical protein